MKRRLTDKLRIGNVYSLEELAGIMESSKRGYKVSAAGIYSLTRKKEIKRVNGNLEILVKDLGALVGEEGQKRKKRELVSLEIKFMRLKSYPVKLGEEEYLPNFKVKFRPYAGEYRLFLFWQSLSGRFGEKSYG